MTTGFRFATAVLAGFYLAVLLAACGAEEVSDGPETDEGAVPAPELDVGPWGPPGAALGEGGGSFRTGPCVNLGNALDAPREGDWGWRIEARHFPVIRDAGFETVRIPIRWSAHTGPEPDYTIDPAFLARVDEVIRLAREAGLKVIINVHHFRALMADPLGERARFLSIWRQLSGHYEGLPADVSFELLNEPHYRLKGEVLRNLLVAARAIVRERHPSRTLIIGGENYSDLKSVRTVPGFSDPNIVATFHYYDPFQFTHQDAEFLGEVRPRGPVEWGSERERAVLARHAARAARFEAAQGRPVFLGEFGVYEAADHAQRAAWTGAVRAAFEAEGIDWCVWNFTATFPLWNDRDQAWQPGMLEALGLRSAEAPGEPKAQMPDDTRPEPVGPVGPDIIHTRLEPFRTLQLSERIGRR